MVLLRYQTLLHVWVFSHYTLIWLPYQIPLPAPPLKTLVNGYGTSSTSVSAPHRVLTSITDWGEGCRSIKFLLPHKDVPYWAEPRTHSDIETQYFCASLPYSWRGSTWGCSVNAKGIMGYRIPYWLAPLCSVKAV